MNAPIRWGVIGYGNLARRKLGPALRNADRSELVAIMRRDPDELRLRAYLRRDRAFFQAPGRGFDSSPGASVRVDADAAPPGEAFVEMVCTTPSPRSESARMIAQRIADGLEAGGAFRSAGYSPLRERVRSRRSNAARASGTVPFATINTSSSRGSSGSRCRPSSMQVLQKGCA